MMMIIIIIIIIIINHSSIAHLPQTVAHTLKYVQRKSEANLNTGVVAAIKSPLLPVLDWNHFMLPLTTIFMHCVSACNVSEGLLNPEPVTPGKVQWTLVLALILATLPSIFDTASRWPLTLQKYWPVSKRLPLAKVSSDSLGAWYVYEFFWCILFFCFFCFLRSSIGGVACVTVFNSSTITWAATFHLQGPSACWLFLCFQNPLNSDMDYRIFNVHTWSFLCMRIHMGKGK